MRLPRGIRKAKSVREYGARATVLTA